LNSSDQTSFHSAPRTVAPINTLKTQAKKTVRIMPERKQAISLRVKARKSIIPKGWGN
jgi:hypothetical protein